MIIKVILSPTADVTVQLPMDWRLLHMGFYQGKFVLWAVGLAGGLTLSRTFRLVKESEDVTQIGEGSPIGTIILRAVHPSDERAFHVIQVH